jgi:hypothetical protein
VNFGVSFRTRGEKIQGFSEMKKGAVFFVGLLEMQTEIIMRFPFILEFAVAHGRKVV